MPAPGPGPSHTLIQHTIVAGARSADTGDAGLRIEAQLMVPDEWRRPAFGSGVASEHRSNVHRQSVHRKD
jgi:hypothetical protein